MEPNESSSDINEAIVIFLRRYPGKNTEEFDSVFGESASWMLGKVRETLDEAMRTEVNWDGLSLIEGGEAMKSIMAAQHPELSEAALVALARYYTFLMR